MKDHYDPWYVRLPDGRTIKAKSTASVRHHVEAGHIPLNSLVRRDSNEEWVSLVWVAEFADLARATGPVPPMRSGIGTGPVPRAGVASRLDPLRLETVGVRGLIDELIAALDSTLTRSKIVPAFVAAILLYVGMYAARLVVNGLFEPPGWVSTAASAAVAVLILTVLNAVLAKLTHLELSTMRPARLREAMSSFGSYVGSVLAANVLLAGGGLILLFVLGRVPEWADSALDRTGMSQSARDAVIATVLLVVYALSVLIWIVIGLCWLLAPAIVVEESSWLAGVREWRQLLREHFGRIVVYEGMTLMLGVAISLPLTVAVGLTVYGAPVGRPAWPVGFSDETRWQIVLVLSAVQGIAAGPFLALLSVANVFIYLNLRYEQATGR